MDELKEEVRFPVRLKKRYLGILEKSIGLISDETKWCRESGALDKAGGEVEPRSRNAVQWCAVGAITKFCPKSNVGLGENIRQFVEELTGSSIVDTNDDLGRVAVIRLLKKATTSLKKSVTAKKSK